MQSEVHSKQLNVYGAITAKIARGIQNAGTYEMPWHATTGPLLIPKNAVTKSPYRGVNILSLWLDATAKNYQTGYWASYKQWQSLGAQVKRGEHGSIIIFYKRIEQTDLEIAAGEPQRSIGRAYWVFNAAQTSNWEPPPPNGRSSVQVNEEVAAFIDAVGATVDHGYARALYRRDLDRIEMPSPSWFHDTKTRTASEAYHAVLLHELTHWSGAAHRIGREFPKRLGSQAYAFEELVAELGAAFMCSAFGITNEPRADHAAFVADWLHDLNNDPRAIFTAAHKAQEAIEYLGSIAGEKLHWFEAVPSASLEVATV